jgi:hypothetical protein
VISVRPMALVRSTNAAVARLRDHAGTTPGRLRLISVLLAGTAVVVGLAGTVGVSDAQSDVSRTSDQYRLHVALADADLQAANEFLSNCTIEDPHWVAAPTVKLTYCPGSVEIAGHRKQYLDAMNRATAGLKQVAEDSGAGSPASQQLQDLDAQVAEYGGLIEAGRVYTGLGQPVGAAYLRAASTTMHRPRDGTLARVDALYSRDLERGILERTALLTGELLLATILLMGLLMTQSSLRRRFRRRYNAPMAVATVLVVPLCIWTAVLVIEVGQVSVPAPGQTLVRWHSQQRALELAHDVAADQSLSLVPGGSSTRFDIDEKQLVTLLEAGVQSAAPGAEQSAAVLALQANDNLMCAHRAISGKVDAGQLGDAISTLSAGGPEQCNLGFARYAQQLDDSLSRASRVEETLFDPILGLSRAGVAGTVRMIPLGIGLLIGILVLLGLQPRIDEYREVR